MSHIQSTLSDLFIISSSAFDRIKEIREKNLKTLGVEVVLNIDIVGGGCSGFKHIFSIEEINKNDQSSFDFCFSLPNETDYSSKIAIHSKKYFISEENEDNDEDENDYMMKSIILNYLDIPLITVKKIILGNYLNGASLDYEKTLRGSSFRLLNTSDESKVIKSKCGCGSSFQV